MRILLVRQSPIDVTYVHMRMKKKEEREREKESKDYAHQRRRTRRQARLWFVLLLCTSKRFACKFNERKHLYAENRRRGAKKQEQTSDAMTT